MTELERMAQDPELSTPRKDAAAWALAEIARLLAQIAAPGDGEIAALVGLLGEVENDPDMIHRDERCYNIAAKAASALTALQADLAAAEADLAAAVARAEKAEGRCLTAATIGRAQSLALYRWEDWDVADMASAVKVIQAVAALPDAKGEK